MAKRKFIVNIEATSFIKKNGTSSQILRADGSVDGNIYTSLKRVGSNLPTTVSKVSGNHTIDFSANNNFLINASGSYSIVASISAANVGQSGMITIVNSAGVTPGNLPSNLLTSNGHEPAWVTASGKTSILSYYVINATQAIVNYIGDFS